MKNRYLVYTLGPTGSGKTYLRNIALREIEQMENKKINMDNDVYDLDIDTVVQNDDIYIKKIRKLLSDVNIIYNDNKKYKLVTHDKTIINKIIHENFKKFEKIYFDVRKNDGCRKQITEIEKYLGVSNMTPRCDIVVDHDLLRHINKETPIIIYESIGTRIDKSILSYSKNKMIKEETNKKVLKTKDDFNIQSKGNLKIILAFSIVSLKELMHRSNDRGFANLRDFVESNAKVYAPRFPDVSDSKQSKLYENNRMFIKLLKRVCDSLVEPNLSKISNNIMGEKVSKLIVRFNERFKTKDKRIIPKEIFIIDFEKGGQQEKINNLYRKLNRFIKKNNSLN